MQACCGAALDGVTLDADMYMPRSTSVHIRNGITVNGTIRMGRPAGGAAAEGKGYSTEGAAADSEGSAASPDSKADSAAA